MRVAVLGRTKMLFNTIKLLEEAGHEIVLIGTCKESPEYDITAADFKEEAQKREIPFFNTGKINSSEIVELIKGVHAELAVSMNWLTLIGEEVISCFKFGILNAHPGDLPRYRGNACPNWAMIQDEDKIGVSVHYMDPYNLDAGNIVLKEMIEIDENTEIVDIYEELEARIPKMFVTAANQIAAGTDRSVIQDKQGLRCYPRKPADGRIDWNCTCRYISGIVRASGYPFAGAYTYFEDDKLYIERVSYKEYPESVLVIPGQVVEVDRKNNRIGIAAADGIITVEKGYFESNPNKEICDIVNSTRMRMGYSVEDEIYQLKKEIAHLHFTIENILKVFKTKTEGEK